MKKQVLTILMALAMIASLAACGGSGGDSGDKSAAGTYKLITLNTDGMEMSVEEMAALFGTEIEVTLEMKEDNSFTLDMGFLGEGESVSGTWKMDGSDLILSAEGDNLSVDYDGKTIVVDLDGEGLTFEKQ